MKLLFPRLLRLLGSVRLLRLFVGIGLLIDMANTLATFEEIRFDIRDPKLTNCYILIKNEGEYLAGLQGWHYMVFSSDVDCLQILADLKSGKLESPCLWPLKAPTGR